MATNMRRGSIASVFLRPGRSTASPKSLERHRDTGAVTVLGSRTLEQPGVDEALDFLGGCLRVSPSQLGSHHVNPELEHLEGGEQSIAQGLRRRLRDAEVAIVAPRMAAGQLGLGFAVRHTLILRVSVRLSIHVVAGLGEWFSRFA
jgi:hypothetical protein